ncbi:hypothetical protein AAHS21_27515 [Mycobacterium sp. 050272]|uniref:hypothetical protein n=1 Tax=Mycobacterium sp. 050272 TaxID=3142488 RepID=UPI003189052F
MTARSKKIVATSAIALMFMAFATGCGSLTAGGTAGGAATGGGATGGGSVGGVLPGMLP